MLYFELGFVIDIFLICIQMVLIYSLLQFIGAINQDPKSIKQENNNNKNS